MNLRSCFSLARSRTARRALLAVSLSVALLPSPRAQTAPTAPKETWLGVYLSNKKIGHMRTRIEPTTYDGKPAIRMTSDSDMHLTMLGADVTQTETGETVTDANYQPLTQITDVKSNGSALHLEARYDYAAHKIYCKLGTGPDASEKALDIPPGVKLTADSTFAAEGQKVKEGEKFTYTYLNPITIALEQVKIDVSAREQVTDHETGAKVMAWRVRSLAPVGEFVSWETDDGDTIRGEMHLGGLTMAMEKETKETALRSDDTLGGNGSASGGTNYSPPRDFAVATSIKTDHPIGDPRALRSLDVTIQGIPDDRLILSDDRQRTTQTTSSTDRGITARYAMRSDTTASADTAQLPVTDPKLTPFLDKTAYLDTDDAAIRARAMALRGDEKNLYKIAVRVRNWVHSVMVPDASIGVPRTATDIFKRRVGVCRDYSTLFAAIARAAGVPTRICGGIVYGVVGGNGGFFYHAWDECWVGKWVAFDATLYDPLSPVTYVDATHIKFAQGDVTDMFNSVNVIGKLKVSVTSQAR